MSVPLAAYFPNGIGVRSVISSFAINFRFVAPERYDPSPPCGVADIQRILLHHVVLGTADATEVILGAAAATQGLSVFLLHYVVKPASNTHTFLVEWVKIETC